MDRRFFLAASGSFAILASKPAWPSSNADGDVEASRFYDIVVGSQAAPVTIVEYASLTCPHCAAFQRSTFPELKRKLIDTGKAKLIYRDFPLDNLAVAATLIVRCSEKTRRGALTEALMRKQSVWVTPNDPIGALKAVAKSVGLSEASVDASLRNQSVLNGIIKDRYNAISRFGINATPTFFIKRKRRVGEISIAEIDSWLL